MLIDFPKHALAAPVLLAVSGMLGGCYFAVGFDSGNGVRLEIVQSPESTTVAAGQSAIFTVGAAGSGRITFQWQRNGVAIVGATGSAYVTPPTTLADDGTLFTVRVCDDWDCATTSPALLTVLR